MKRIHLILTLVLTTLTLGLASSASAQRWDWNSEASTAQLRKLRRLLERPPQDCQIALG